MRMTPTRIPGRMPALRQLLRGAAGPRGHEERAIAPATFRRLALSSAMSLACGAMWLVGLCALSGCRGEDPSHYASVSQPPKVQLTQPQLRKIVRTVGQPSFIETYERTSIYPKLTAYIDNWVVDIGDKVKKDDVLATLFVPELVEEFRTKEATVKLDEERVRLAEQVVKVAEADVKAAEARLQEAKEILGKYEAEVERWDVQVKRLQREVDRRVVDPQILLESQNQLKSNTAAREAAKAAIQTAEADLLAARETLAKDQVDVVVAKADLAVATSEWKKTGALVGYLTLRAPFDGMIYERNANTFDFVLPTTGDPTANRRAPDISSARAAPIYVVDRTDIVRVFVDIPERDANYVRAVDLRLMDAPKDLSELPEQGRDLVIVARLNDRLHFRIFDSDGKRVVDTGDDQWTDGEPHLAGLKSLLGDEWDRLRIVPAGTASDGVWDRIPGRARQISPIVKDKILDALGSLVGRDRVPRGSKARVLVNAYSDQPIEGTVTRTSWALNVTSRTLRAEIDLHNPESQLLPGMYAYAYVIIERPNVRALPTAVLTYEGDHTYCWLYEDGRAQRVAIRTGVSDGEWIEVTSLERSAKSEADPPWTPVTGSESVILGDLSILADGAPVQVASGAEPAADTPKTSAQRHDEAPSDSLAHGP